MKIRKIERLSSDIENERYILKNKKMKKQLILTSCFLLLGIISLVGTSYAVFNKLIYGEKAVYISVGDFKTTFLEGEYVNLSNISTMSLKEVNALKPYEFIVENEGTMDAYYQVSLTDEGVKNNTSMVDKKYLGYSLTGSDGTSLEGTLDELGSSMILIRQKYLKAGEKVQYSFKVWLTEDATNNEMGKTYRSKVSVSTIQTTNTLADKLIGKSNQEGVSYSSGDQKQMFLYNQEATPLTTRAISYRYIGDHPSNYLILNGDLYRIIGVFASLEGDSYNPQVKIIKEKGFDAPYGTKNTEPSYLVDEAYLSQDEITQKIFTPFPVYLGGVYSKSSGGEIYLQERTMTNRPFTSYNHLLSLSDYVYTFASHYNDSCFNNISACHATSWINKGNNEALLSPVEGTTDQVFSISTDGSVLATNVSTSLYQRPVFYLAPSVLLKGGDGTEENPYRIML